MPFDQIKYQNQYNKDHYSRMSVLVSLDERPLIEAHWKKRGYKSFNAFVTDLIRKDMSESRRTVCTLIQSIMQTVRLT